MSGVDHRHNGVLAAKMAFIACAMFGFGFAMVPLYDVLCNVTGINPKVSLAAAQAEAYPIDSTRQLTVEFLASVDSATHLDFRPERAKIKLSPGEYVTTHFYAKNTTDHKLVGQAIPSIVPGEAVDHFKKIECFCFSKQVFEPGEEKLMAVRFVVDPQLPAKVKTITLSYAFFDVTNTL